MNKPLSGKDLVEYCKVERRSRWKKARNGKPQEPMPMYELPRPDLPYDWTWASIDELCERVSVGHVGPTSEYFCDDNSGIPLIRSQDVRPGRLFLENAKHITLDFHKSLKKSTLKPGDILVVRVGSNRGDSCIVPDGITEINCANVVFARPIMPNNFLGIYIQSKLAQELLQSISSGSAQGVLNTTAIARIPVPVPPVFEQRAIAGILGALDDKIEINRRMNATLESMARTVFRQWFVENEEVGSWKVGKLGDVSENIRRSTNADEIAPETHYIGLEHMPRGSIALAEWGNASELASNKFIFKQGEFLFGKLRPYFHKVGIAPIDGVCSTDILVIAPKSPEWYGFVLGHISSAELINYTSAASTGTKMPRTNWSDIARYEVVIPPVKVAKEFNEIFKPMAQQIRTNIMQSRTLASLRDSLLPKLMRGEVRVSAL